MRDEQPDQYFDDLAVGAVRECQGGTISAESIIDFATQFDPEPFHTDRVAARDSVFGDLVASGAHTFAMWRRMSWESIRENRWMLIAGLGFDEMRLRRPVKPGDRLRLHSELVEKIPSRSRADRGIVRTRETLFNQHDEVVFTMVGMAMAARRT